MPPGGDADAPGPRATPSARDGSHEPPPDPGDGDGGGGPPPVLRAEGLRVRYGGELVVAVDELELREGELLVLLGPNGAGKSTLVRVLAMLEAPDEGRVLFRGESGSAAEDALRDASTAVFQRPHLWDGTVGDNLRLGLRLGGVPKATARERLAATAQALALEDLLDRDVDDLSAGEVQRAALGRALAPEPEVLFLDEPTSDLDARARDALRRDVDRFARTDGRSTLLVTHDRREAFRLADRIVVLENGRTVRAGTPREIYERPGSRYVARVSGAELTLRGRVTQASVGEGDPSLEAEGPGLLRVAVGEVSLLAVGDARPGDEVAVAYRPEDLALARGAEREPGGGDEGLATRRAAEAAEPGRGPDERPEADDHAPGEPPPGRDSVRNAFPATVRDVREVRGLVRIHLQGPPDVVAVVTRGSAEAMGLEAGVAVRVRVKAAALHAFAR